jgi:hypothetical protein
MQDFASEISRISSEHFHFLQKKISKITLFFIFLSCCAHFLLYCKYFCKNLCKNNYFRKNVHKNKHFRENLNEKSAKISWHQSISPKVVLIFHRLLTSFAFCNKIKAKSTFVNFCEYFRQDFREIYFVIFVYFCNFREDSKMIFAKRRKIKILVLAVATALLRLVGYC